MTERIIPTNEELKILRDKLANVKDLYYINDNTNIHVINKMYAGIEQSRHSPKISVGIGPTICNDVKETLSEKSVRMVSQGVNYSHSVTQQKEEELGLMSSKYNDLQRYIEANQEKLEGYDQVVKENHELKLQLKKSQEKSSDVQINADNLQECLKLKAEIARYKMEIEKKEKIIFHLEKENQMLRAIDSSSANGDYLKHILVSFVSRSNKPTIDEPGMKLISEVFGVKKDLVKFLIDRIDCLEFQNYSLISKNEKFANIISSTIDELIEYIDVIFDIKNVLNQVNTNTSQGGTKDLIVIKETLNKRANYLETQKASLLLTKQNLETDETKDRNIQVILCKDKIIEGKTNLQKKANDSSILLHSNPSSRSIPLPGGNKQVFNSKLLEILDEKIEHYESLKNNLAMYEDFLQFLEENSEDATVNPNLKVKESLLNENYFLKSKNIKLRNIVMELLKNKEIYIDERLLAELNEISNTGNDVLINEDLFALLLCQSQAMENFI